MSIIPLFVIVPLGAAFALAGAAHRGEAADAVRAGERLVDGQLARATARLVAARGQRGAARVGLAATADRAARDIDLGLLGNPPSTWKTLPAMADAMADAWGSPPLPLDLRLLRGASPVFTNQVLLHGTLVYEADREARLRFEVQAMSQWLDFRPVYERVRAQVLARWADG